MLNIVNKSPLDRPSLQSCLRVMGTAPEGDALLLIEDAVYAATRGHALADALGALVGRCPVYALRPDLEARGLADRLIEGVGTVDYAGFVELVASHPNNQTWL